MSETSKIMSGVIPHLRVNSAAEAADFYKKVLGAKEHGRIPSDDGKRLLHCHLEVNGGSFFVMDHFPEQGYGPQPSDNYTMTLVVPDVDEWWNRAMSADCEVIMPLEVQFWGDRYGSVRDPFGIQWAFNEVKN